MNELQKIVQEMRDEVATGPVDVSWVEVWADRLAKIAEQGDWRPIETAPKGGPEVILWAEGWLRPAAGKWFGAALGGWKPNRKTDPFFVQPTRFHPLPEPPK